MSVIHGPNLVGGSLSDAVVPVYYDHGPWETSNHATLVALCHTNDTRGSTVSAGANYFYTQSAYAGNANWTRQTSGYPTSGTQFHLTQAQAVKSGDSIVCLSQVVATGKYSIAEYNTLTATYGSLGNDATLVLSTLYPILLVRMANGDTLVFATGAGGASGFYRYNGSTWSGFNVIRGSSFIAAATQNGGTCAHVMVVVDSGGKSIYYYKISADNSIGAAETVATGTAYNSVGNFGGVNYGHCYDILANRMFVAADGNDQSYAIVTSALDDTATNPTFSTVTAFALPDAAEGNFNEIFYGNIIPVGSDLWIANLGLEYDEDGNTVSDIIYGAQWNGSGFNSRIALVDFVAHPPTIDPPAAIPPPPDQYSHFHSMHGFADGSAGSLNDFLVADGGVFCTSYYTNWDFASDGGEVRYESDTLALSDSVSYFLESPDLAYLISDTLALLDSAVAAPHNLGTAGAADTLVLSDHVNLAVTTIGGSGGGTGVGGSGGQEGGGPTNAPNYCIFEFYEMMAPENVETLPVPKKYDQLGPMRFDKIAKVFGFRIRLIMTGTTTSMPFEIYGDDSASHPHYGNLLYNGSFDVLPGIDYLYEIQLPKNVNSDIIRLVLGPTSDEFHRYDVLMKIQTSGMQGQSKWMPIR